MDPMIFADYLESLAEPPPEEQERILEQLDREWELERSED